MSDRYIIGYFMGSAPVGIYAAAYGVGNTILMFISPISTVLYPTISKLWEEDKLEDVKTHLKYSVKYFLMIAIPSAFGLSVLSKELLVILATSEFVSAGSVIIPVVAFSTLIYGFYSIATYVLTSARKTHYIGALLAVAAVTNIILNVVLIPLFGILGAAIATLITFFELAALTLYLSFKELRFDLNFGFIVKSVIASMIMSGLILKYNPVGTVNVLISIGFGGVIYFGLIWLLKGINKDELKVLKSTVR